MLFCTTYTSIGANKGKGKFEKGAKRDTPGEGVTLSCYYNIKLPRKGSR